MPIWIWLVMPGCAIAVIVMWFILGKDKKTVPVISVRPPGGLDPLEMEYAQIANITDRGIYAMILYWISKGILEVDEKARVGVRRVGELPSGAPEHAKFLFGHMFRRMDLVRLDRLPATVANNKRQLCDKVKSRFTGRNAVVQDDSMYPTLGGMFLLIAAIFVTEVEVDAGVIFPAFLGILLLLGLIFLQDGALGFQSKYDTFEVVGGTIMTALAFLIHLILLGIHTQSGVFVGVFAVSFLVCIPCILFMERRTNHKLYGQILGFRQYIESAEWEKLKALSEENPDYGMEILPYAMLFGMGTQWTKLFENKTIYAAVETMEAQAKDR